MANMLHTSIGVLDFVLECVAPHTPFRPQGAKLAASLALSVRLCARDPAFLVELSAQTDEVQLLMGDRESPGDVCKLVPECMQLVQMGRESMDAGRAGSQLVCEEVEDIEIPTTDIDLVRKVAKRSVYTYLSREEISCQCF